MRNQVHTTIEFIVLYVSLFTFLGIDEKADESELIGGIGVFWL
jgi:hypothetical protein